MSEHIGTNVDPIPVEPTKVEPVSTIVDEPGLRSKSDLACQVMKELRSKLREEDVRVATWAREEGNLSSVDTSVSLEDTIREGLLAASGQDVAAFVNKEPQVAVLQWARKWKETPRDVRTQLAFKYVLDKTRVFKNSNNILYMACRAGDYEKAKLLIELGASVSLHFPRHSTDFKSSALHIAMWCFHVDVVVLLRQHGANLCAMNADRDLPIHDARCIDDYARPEDHTVLSNAFTYKLGLNIFPDSVLEAEGNLVRKLCQQFVLTDEEAKVLERACTENVELIWTFPQQRETTEQSWTCLHVACAVGNERALTILIQAIKALKKNQSFSVRDVDGWNPLHCLVARAAVCNKRGLEECNKLKRMSDALVKYSSDEMLVGCSYNREDPWRQRLLYKMWEVRTEAVTMGSTTFTSSNNMNSAMVCRLYLNAVLPKDEPNVDKYKGWLWIDDMRNDCVVTMLPRAERKLRITLLQSAGAGPNSSSSSSFMAGSSEKDIFIKKMYDKLYMDEFRNILREWKPMYDNAPPADDDVVMNEVPTLLPMTDPMLESIEWNLGDTGLVLVGMRLKRVFIVENNPVEEYEALKDGTDESYIVKLRREESEDSDDLAASKTFTPKYYVSARPKNTKEQGTLETRVLYENFYSTTGWKGIPKVLPNTVPRGYNPIAWAMLYRVQPFCSPGCIPAGSYKDKEFASDNVLFGFLVRSHKLDSKELADSYEFLNVIHAIPDKPKDWYTTVGVVNESAKHPAPANRHRTPIYIAVTNEPDPFVAREVLGKLNMIATEGGMTDIRSPVDASFGTSRTERRSEMTEADLRRNETTLIHLLHNACSIGDRRGVERVLLFMKIFTREWNDGAILNRPLHVATQRADYDQYAVSVAAESGNTEILKLLARYDVDFLVGDGIALRRAILRQKFETAEWIVSNYPHAEFEKLPSLEKSRNSRAVPFEELKFCHQHKLLNAVYEETYIVNSAFWDVGQREEVNPRDVRRGEIGRSALMIIDLQLDFFHSTEHLPEKKGSLPVQHATDEFAKKAATFIRQMSKQCNTIIVARDWHPPGHFSFASSHGKAVFDTVLDTRTGKPQTLWPDHCVQHTRGAEVHPAIMEAVRETKMEWVVVDSGINKEVDSYSTFYDNNKAVKSSMHDELLRRGIEDIFMFGIATDVCVAHSAMDALTLGFDVFVVKDLCAAVMNEAGERMLEKVNKRGGQIITSKGLLQYFKAHDKKSEGKQANAQYSIDDARLVKALMGFSGIRYYMLFQSNVNCGRLLGRLNGFDFGSQNPREGELYLTLTALMNTMKDAFKFRLHGLWFETTGANKQYDSQRDQATRYPLHYLMMLAKYSTSVVHQQNALELLISAVKFINEYQGKVIDAKGQEIYRIAHPKNKEEIITLTKLAREVPPVCTVEEAVHCKCIYHIHVTEATQQQRVRSPLLSQLPDAIKLMDPSAAEGPRPTRGVCSVGRRIHVHNHDKKKSERTLQHLNHVLNCTPLMLAVRLRLTRVVEAMLIVPSESSPPIVLGEMVSGRDVNGERFTFQDISDLWYAVPQEINADGTVAMASSPAFHYLLRSSCPIQSVDETMFPDYQVISSPECDEYVAIQDAPGTIAPLNTYTYHPACGARRPSVDEIVARERILIAEWDVVLFRWNALFNYLERFPDTYFKLVSKSVNQFVASLDLSYSFHENPFVLYIDMRELKVFVKCQSLPDHVMKFVKDVQTSVEKVDSEKRSVDEIMKNIMQHYQENFPTSPIRRPGSFRKHSLNPNVLEEEMPLQDEDQEEDEHPQWKIPCGLQWLCPECGTYIHDCYHVDFRDRITLSKDLKRDAVESLLIARVFLQACTRYTRTVTIAGQQVDTVEIEDRTCISRWVDVSGLYVSSGAYYDKYEDKFCNGDSGFSLLFQYMPDVVPEISTTGVLAKCPLSRYEYISSLIQDSSCTIRVRRRHLWKVTRGGHQIIVYDRGLSILQCVCLINATDVLRWLMDFPDFDILSERPSERLGYYALHYACFGCSVETLRILLLHVSRKYSGDVLANWVNRQAIHDIDKTTLTYYEAFGTDTKSFVASMSCKALNRKWDPAAYPKEEHSQQEEGDYYGKFNAIGETALHVVAAYGHYPCLAPLLEHRADPLIKTSLEGLDAHDVAISLQHRFQLQLLEARHRKHEKNFFSNWKEEARVEKERQDETVLGQVVDTLNEIDDVKYKLQQYGTMRFFFEHGPYFAFVIILIVYTMLFNSNSVSRTRDDYFAISKVIDAIENKQLKYSVPDNPWVKTVNDVNSLGDLTTWLQDSFRNVVFENPDNPTIMDGGFRQIGAVRIQQLRATTTPCPSIVQKYMKTFVPDHCTNRWDTSTNRVSPVNTTWASTYTNYDAFTVRTGITSQTSGILYLGAEGYVYDISRNTTLTTNMTLDEQFEVINTLFDSDTRFVTVYVAVYSYEYDRFVSIGLSFEILDSGGVTFSSSYVPLRTNRKEGILLALYIILVLFVVNLAITEATDFRYTATKIRHELRSFWREVIDDMSNDETSNADTTKIAEANLKPSNAAQESTSEGGNTTDKSGIIKCNAGYFKNHRVPVCSEFTPMLVKDKDKLVFHVTHISGQVFTSIRVMLTSVFIFVREIVEHFSSDWNIVDWVVLLLLVTSFAMDDTYDRNFVNVETVFETQTFVDFTIISKAWTLTNLCLSMATLLALVTLLKCVNFIPNVGPIAAAIVGTIGTREVITFISIFFLVVTSFMLCVTNAFGYRLSDYRSMHSSFFRIFSVALGNGDYDNMTGMHYTLGPFLFIFSIGFMNIILLNTFIAVIGEVYNERVMVAHQSWSKVMIASYREVQMKLLPLRRYRGTVFNTQLKRLLSLIFPKGSTLQGFFYAHYKYDVTDVPIVPNSDEDEREAATTKFFCRRPHLSTWNCVSQIVNDITSESQRQIGVTQDDMMKEIKKLSEAVAKLSKN